MTRWTLALGFIATIVVANALTAHLGLIPAGFGLLVTAGTYSAGLALGLRDALHEVAGLRWVVAAILAGAVVSTVVSPSLAVASAAAFLLGELFDLAVYAPLRRRGHRRAVAVSNAAGAVVDTFVFLWLAGFSLTTQSVGGQLLVKAVWVTAAFLIVSEVVRRALPRKPLHPIRTTSNEKR